MSYIKTSTSNPLGTRPFNSRIATAPPGRSSGYSLQGYYPAEFFVPTPMNVTMRSQPSIGLSGLGDFFPNYPALRAGGWRTRDDVFSPIPRIYLPPEGVMPGSGPNGNPTLGFLGDDPFMNLRALVEWQSGRRGRFSGGVHVADPNNPQGVFYPGQAQVPVQFAPSGTWPATGPNPGAGRGFYYPQRPGRVLPAALRTVDTEWTALGRLGAAAIVRAPAKSTGGFGTGIGTVLKVAPPTPVKSLPTPTLHPPIVVTGTGVFATNQPPPRSPVGVSPSGQVIPGTAPTYPTGVVPVGGGMCSVTSTPETGGDTSVVPCAGVPGYSAGTASTYVPPSYPNYPPYYGAPAPTGGGINMASVQAYQAAMIAVQNGTLTQANLVGLSPAQQNAVIRAANTAATASSATSSAYSIASAAANQGLLTSAMLTGLTSAQQQALIAANNNAISSGSAAAQQAAAAGAAGAGGASTTTDTGTDYSSILDWLSEQTLINGIPNWVPIAVGGLGAVWLMNRGKK